MISYLIDCVFDFLFADVRQQPISSTPMIGLLKNYKCVVGLTIPKAA